MPRFIALPLLLLSLLLVPCGAAHLHALETAASEPPLSRFHRIAIALEDASPEDRRAFAQAALNNLVAVFSAESDLARREARRDRDSGEAMHWVGAVDAYTRRLAWALDAVNAGDDVQVVSHRSGVDLAVPSVNLRAMLEHPRSGQQAAYEQSVLAEFCRGDRCRELETLPLAATPDIPRRESAGSRGGREAIPVTAGAPRIDWAFDLRGPACSAAGLTLRFPVGTAASGMRQVCEQVHAEVAAILVEVRWQLERGVVVDWPSLALTPRTDRRGHALQLNSAGDAALVRAPLVAGSPGLLQELANWLGNRANGGVGVIEVRAGRWQWAGGTDWGPDA